MRTSILPVALTSLALSLAAGCASEGPVGPGDGDGDNPNEDPVAGQYQLTSTIDLSTSDNLPNFLGDVLGPLSGLADNPGATIISILEETDDSIADLLDLVPSNLREELEDKINEFVDEQIAGGTAAGDIIVWVDDIAGILTNFEVVSQFEIGYADADGVANGNHKLTAVRFTLQGETQQVDTPEIINTLSAATGVSCSINGNEIGIGEHAFHLPLGELAVVAFNQALEKSLGAANIGEALDMLVDCADVAERVGPLCLGPVCLPVENMCNDGLAAVADEIEQRIEAIDFAEMRLAEGRAALEAKSDSASGQIDEWAQGTWKTNIEVDSLLTLGVDATFQATRL